MRRGAPVGGGGSVSHRVSGRGRRLTHRRGSVGTLAAGWSSSDRKGLLKARRHRSGSKATPLNGRSGGEGGARIEVLGATW